MASKRTPAYVMALGGVLAALAVVFMCMGTLIPVATYVCPVLCTVLLQLYYKAAGSRMGWVWFVAVALLSLLLAPDKEAAAVFWGIGYYPMVKPKLDAMPAPWLWKALLFNGTILIIYGAFLRLLGLDAVLAEFTQMGSLMTGIMLILGNVTFFMLDKLLSKRFQRGGK